VRPLLITDCDEVLVHMVRHFRTWLGDTHQIDFALDAHDFHAAMTRRDGGPKPSQEEMWGYLGGFFPAEMARQTLVPGAAEALARFDEGADIVILTNLQDACHAARVEQLAAFGIAHRVVCNQGGKGAPVAALVAEYKPSVTVFVDDLAVHHDSVARQAPEVHRLHLIAEPELAGAMPPAPAAHARIDDWPAAADWIAARFAAGEPAHLPVLEDQA
jgi:hypothetical protein